MGKLLVLNIQYKLKHYNLLHIDEFYLLLGEKFAFTYVRATTRRFFALVLLRSSANVPF